MWTANGYIKNPIGNAGKPQIPSLKANPTENIATVDTNTEKAALLAIVFFPKKPNKEDRNNSPQAYKEPLATNTNIMEKMVKKQILSLLPSKALGLDSIPNIVLQQNTDTILQTLAEIFTATLKKGYYYQGWKKSITCILQKPGQPSYKIPKAYCPKVLLSTIGKLLSAIIAADISRLIEEHNLLLENHFGGRQGKTTTESDRKSVV